MALQVILHHKNPGRILCNGAARLPRALGKLTTSMLPSKTSASSVAALSSAACLRGLKMEGPMVSRACVEFTRQAQAVFAQVAC